MAWYSPRLQHTQSKARSTTGHHTKADQTYASTYTAAPLPPHRGRACPGEATQSHADPPPPPAPAPAGQAIKTVLLHHTEAKRTLNELPEAVLFHINLHLTKAMQFHLTKAVPTLDELPEAMHLSRQLFPHSMPQLYETPRPCCLTSPRLCLPRTSCPSPPCCPRPRQHWCPQGLGTHGLVLPKATAPRDWCPKSPLRQG